MNKQLLGIHNVCLSYGERHVLCHIEARVNQGDCIVLVGPNGGGKTTLLRLLAGLLPPTAGYIERAPAVVGYLPQYRHIDRQFPTTVGDIVLSGLSCRKRIWQRFTAAHRQRVAETLEQFSLGALADRPISDLSGGQWQRTLLARAFVSNPDLLLLDEPETHLDDAARAHLYDLLQQYARQCAMVVVSHDVEHFPDILDRQVWRVDGRQELLVH